MEETVQWLLDGDPAIRWQVQRDLLGRAEGTWKRERARVAQEGWGADLLSRQDPDGGWSNAVYSPKWTSTHYTLLQLVRMGLPTNNPAARRGITHLLEAGRYQDGAINLAKTVPEPDVCVNGMVLLMASFFGVTGPVTDGIARWLVGSRMEDGGWNCDHWRGATHSSFHSTLSVLEGLAAHRAAAEAPVRGAVGALSTGHEFLLAHRIYKSHRTDEIADRAFTLFSFPPRWHYDALRALDYFQSVDAKRDRRFEDAIELLRTKRRPNGRWPVQNYHPGRVHFRMESGGRPSRWNTLRALRVLRWWEG